MYVLIKNNAIAQYPYTIGNLRRDNPSTSFPKHPTDETLADWGMRRVAKTDRPTYEHTKNISEGAPVLVGGVWTQVWNVADATSDEIAKRNEQASNSLRSQRDDLIAATDFYALSDVTMSNDMAAYRQALRDITAHANWPNLTDVDWPTKP